MPPARPSVKELELRYGAGYRTVTKALRSLLKSGVLARQGRRYCVAHRPPHVSNAEVLVFLYREDDHLAFAYYDQHLFARLETMCRDPAGSSVPTGCLLVPWH